MTETKTRCGIVAILGAPNAGKSTLTNRLVGSKVSIVTPKVQTTRVRLRGVAMEGKTQIVLTDTPGIFAAKRKFEQGMVDEAWAGAQDADVLLMLIDASKGLDEESQAIIDKLQKYKGASVALALNKVDAVDKPYLLKLATACDAFGLFERIFMISAQKGGGVKDLMRWLAEKMPEGEWLYPEDQPTDSTMRDLAAEITREKLFLLLRQEIPYSLKVETEVWEKQKNGLIKIMQTIFVEKEGQKKIVIGDNASTLKRIGTSARREIEALVEGRVNLQLFVKVDEKWKER